MVIMLTDAAIQLMERHGQQTLNKSLDLFARYAPGIGLEDKLYGKGGLLVVAHTGGDLFEFFKYLPQPGDAHIEVVVGILMIWLQKSGLHVDDPSRL